MAFISCFSCLKKQSEEITELDYRHRSLDDVPNDIFNFERTLEILHLDSNNIKDLPRPLFHCHELRYLGLSDNDICSLPTAISSLSQLVSLNVSRNVLTDIPETIKMCKLLAVLEASVNPLQKIPKGCTQLTSLSELYLNDVFLEYLPANFGRLSKLTILELRDNSLNTLPKSMTRLGNLKRIDLGQNQFEEVPEVIQSMILLEELWMDGNRLTVLPTFIGVLNKLKHLDLSINQLKSITPELGNCIQLEDLTLSTNDLRTLPESLGNLENLITLKIEDNQLEMLPEHLGNMMSLEELFCGENFLTSLPLSIGWLRNLHTLNADENDLKELPPEIGSCRNMKILSVHGNKLQGIPRELGQITQISVLNLAGNCIPHLPLSFVKLKSITAIWLSENQTKPLVHLNPDTDPYTGEKVLTNFLLPQQIEGEREGDTISESGSFHAAIWEEERTKRSLVKWAGEEQDLDKTGNLRRAPTPFPKEMRAMAKKVENLREKRRMTEGPGQISPKKRDNVFKPKTGGRRKQKREGPDTPDLINTNMKDMKPGNLTKSPILSDVSGKGGSIESGELDGFKVSDNVSRDSGVVTSSHADSVETQDHSSTILPKSELSVTTKTNILNQGLNFKQDQQIHYETFGNPPDSFNNGPTPVRAEIITNELDDDPPPYHIAAARSRHAGDFLYIQRNYPPPSSEEDHFYENQNGMKSKKQERDSASLARQYSFQSDSTFESISESETSTAPSSLQTIVRAPYANPTQPYTGILEYNSSPESSSSAHMNDNDLERGKPGKIPDLVSSPGTTETEGEFTFANNLRKVSEQILTAGRKRTSMSGSRPGSIAVSSGSPRDVQSRVLGPSSIGQSSSSSSDSRPGSQLSLAPPPPPPLPSSLSGSRPESRVGQPVSRIPVLSSPLPGKESRPGFYPGPPNTVGLPPVSSKQQHQLTIDLSVMNLNYAKYVNPSPCAPKLNHVSSQSELYPDSGLLSTISQAALSDDESPPTTHVSNPPKFNTASLSIQNKVVLEQPNYENIDPPLHNGRIRPTQNVLSKTDKSRHERAPATRASRVVSPLEPGMAQGQFRPAAVQANVFSIPEDPGDYLAMNVKKGSMFPSKGLIPLACSSPADIPTFKSNKSNISK